MQQIQWQDRFSIGVEVVDRAHRRLFSIVDKMMDLYVVKHESKFACVEGIKYFKAYALKHFAEEEAYMRELGYAGYPAHKRIHDRMRYETLPALERELYATDFSVEAVQHFIGTCTGWLTGHIVLEDQAITGKAAREFPPLQLDDELSTVRTIITLPLQEMFDADIQFIGSFPPGDTLAGAQHYELVYRGRRGDRLRFVLVIEEPLLLRAASLLFGGECYARNELVRFAVQEIAQSLLQRAAACFGGDFDAYQLESDRFLKAEEFESRCQKHSPQHSLLFRVGQDCFVLCIDQTPPTDLPQP